MGEVRRLGDERAGPRVRRRTLRRWIVPTLAGGLVVGSLVAVVGRGEEGRGLSRELDRLEGDELIVRDQVAGQTARADSLRSLSRIEKAAAEIGLRQAEDGEFFHLSDDRPEMRSGIDERRPVEGADGGVRR